MALAPCSTVDVPYIADAEIVLEAEVLPTGWTWPEGRFGEFTRLMGGLHWNPLVRIKAIAMRKDAIYYNLHMPWENTWLAAPTRYAAIRQALRTAGVQVKDINVTLGGCAFWHAVISIKKQPGEGKNALLAALSVMDLKHVVVVDDDIDVNDPGEVEWAIATRVQGDRDVMIVSNARAKPLDPSLPQGYGVVPTGAKVGIDATIPEGIPREYYERITYAYAESAKIDDYVNGKKDAAGARGDEKAIAALAQQILDVIAKEPLYYTDIAEKFASFDFNTVARAIGHLHATEKLWQDPRGRLCVRGSAVRREAAEAIASEVSRAENIRSERVRNRTDGKRPRRDDTPDQFRHRHREDRSSSQPSGPGRPARQGAPALAIRQCLYRAPRRGDADGRRRVLHDPGPIRLIFIPAGMPHSLSNLSDEYSGNIRNLRAGRPPVRFHRGRMTEQFLGCKSKSGMASHELSRSAVCVVSRLARTP